MPQLLALFVFGFLSSWAHGWALAKLWGWFIVKTFLSLPAITTFQAVGISLVVSVFFSGIYMTLGNLRTAVVVVGKDNDSFTETMLKAVGNSFASMLLSLISVGIGWIWLQIM